MVSIELSFYQGRYGGRPDGAARLFPGGPSARVAGASLSAVGRERARSLPIASGEEGICSFALVLSRKGITRESCKQRAMQTASLISLKPTVKSSNKSA